MQGVYRSDFWHPVDFGCADHESDAKVVWRKDDEERNPVGVKVEIYKIKGRLLHDGYKIDKLLATIELANNRFKTTLDGEGDHPVFVRFVDKDGKFSYKNFYTPNEDIELKPATLACQNADVEARRKNAEFSAGLNRINAAYDREIERYSHMEAPGRL
ncbi:hypothetical protein DdX_20078 [Ditylenchus destructor]|uniref:Uncharacterized protein n=1 Tax=Ditylenchus destructor TaxID=166010 RepID=A0AAD4MI60_9BILA|nr:hypothetical protein DdX_20078 [Ditylenchus destructor]